MRLLTLSKLLVYGAAAAWAYKHRRRFLMSSPVASSSTVAPAAEPEPPTVGDPGPDPGDPVQGFDEVADLHIDTLDLDALDEADAEAAQDLAGLETDLDEAALEIDTPSETTLDAADRAVPHDTGELYGMHTPPAVDRTLAEDRETMDEGQNWLEALETSATEYGAEPEHDVDPIDDADTPPHPSDTRDTPVADRGSGGPSGT